MRKYLAALIAALLINLSVNTALAGQYTASSADETSAFTVSGIFNSGNDAPVLLAAKEWNEDQRNVVQSFQRDRDNSINPEALNLLYTTIALIVLIFLVGYFRKKL